VPRTRRLLTLTCALLLALPGTALAGGAGDDQYEDPFGDEPAGTTTQSAPAPAEPAPSDTDAGGDQAQAAPSTSAPAPATLPRTGADAGLAALGGGVLLLAGLALRRRTADELRD
jgi:LPXTG-motif cell wall-anchored protein